MAKASEDKPQLVESKTLDMHDQILRARICLYEQRGRASGHELEDWYRVEQELKSREHQDAAA